MDMNILISNKNVIEIYISLNLNFYYLLYVYLNTRMIHEI